LLSFSSKDLFCAQKGFDQRDLPVVNTGEYPGLFVKGFCIAVNGFFKMDAAGFYFSSSSEDDSLLSFFFLLGFLNFEFPGISNRDLMIGTSDSSSLEQLSFFCILRASFESSGFT